MAVSQREFSRLFSATGRAIRAVFRQGQDFLLPPQCPVSGRQVADHGDIAPDAWQKLRFLAPPVCGACGIPFQVAASDALLCGACAAPDRYDGALISTATLDCLRAALAYDDESAPLILGLKYGDRHDVVRGLARMLARVGADSLDPADCVVAPVPLHPSRMRQRRFNQAALLAGDVAKLTGRNCIPDLLQRRRATPQQQGLTAKARRRNVRGAFQLNPRFADLVAGRPVVVIDDVLTTGSTMIECARVLKRAGSASVAGLVVARVVKDEIIAI